MLELPGRRSDGESVRLPAPGMEHIGMSGCGEVMGQLDLNELSANVEAARKGGTPLSLRSLRAPALRGARPLPYLSRRICRPPHPPSVVLPSSGR